MQQQSKEFSQNWKKVDPLVDPVLNDLPKHKPELFAEYVELKDENDKVIGFSLNEGNQQYFFDNEGGWRDEEGCYYDKDGQPAGWFVLHPGDVYHEHFYDLDGLYVPSDLENEKNSDDDQDSDDDGDKEKQSDLHEYDGTV